MENVVQKADSIVYRLFVYGVSPFFKQGFFKGSSSMNIVDGFLTTSRDTTLDIPLNLAKTACWLGGEKLVRDPKKTDGTQKSM